MEYTFDAQERSELKPPRSRTGVYDMHAAFAVARSVGEFIRPAVYASIIHATHAYVAFHMPPTIEADCWSVPDCRLVCGALVHVGFLPVDLVLHVLDIVCKKSALWLFSLFCLRMGHGSSRTAEPIPFIYTTLRRSSCLLSIFLLPQQRSIRNTPG